MTANKRTGAEEEERGRTLSGEKHDRAERRAKEA
jgi:hypothetical protein